MSDSDFSQTTMPSEPRKPEEGWISLAERLQDEQRTRWQRGERILVETFLASHPELASDADRILPGEGDFRLEAIVQQLRAIGYDGWVSLELFNPTLWQLKPAQVAELGLASLGRLLRQ